MKQYTVQIATALALLASSVVHAQQAVQWKASDGGNGHWYSVDLSPLWWDAWAQRAQLLGAQLASITSSGEQQNVESLIGSMSSGGYPQLLWLGAIQRQCSWAWTSDEPWGFTAWATGNPNGGCTDAYLGIFVNQTQSQYNLGWDDCICPSSGDGEPTAALLEWSADCNADGIVDYGQCHDGTLPDYNGNNIPDCCERSEACVVGSYPVQWRVEDGGNGHWYRIDATSTTWEVARDRACSQSGYLATITNGSEQRFLSTLDWSIITQWGVWLGARRQSCTWQWVNGESWGYDHWAPNEPSGGCFDAFLLLYVQLGTKYELRWDDCICPPDGTPTGSFIEWSADCNNDDIVDYGQILQGQLADTNTDGIPDTCQCGTIPSLPSCCPGDLDHDGEVGGADIGLLLSNWGPCANACLYDLNNDDKVNGGDLGLLLSGWGPCGN